MERLNCHYFDFASMKGVDVRTVDPDTLVDVGEVVISKVLPKDERLMDFVRQIRNPYCCKCGKTIVKISFADTDATLRERIEGYLRAL